MKKLQELKVDDVIYIYSISIFPNKEVLVKTKVKVYKVNYEYNTVSAFENFDNPNVNNLRRVIKVNEGTVYRNSIWLSEENDEIAKDILIKFFERKIEILINEIKLNQSRISLVNEFFEKEN